MTQDEQKKQQKPLVTVERQTEDNLFTGERETRRFVKMYFEARESGLLADMPADLVKLLFCLATYMDEDGKCWPSQETIARDLGISRQWANKLTGQLRDYRFQGQPVMSVQRERVKRAKGGGQKWGKNVYTLYPITGFVVGRGEPPDRRIRMSTIGDIRISETPMSTIDDIRDSATKSDTSEIDGLGGDVRMSSGVSTRVSPLGRQEQEEQKEQDVHTEDRDRMSTAGGDIRDARVCVDSDPLEGEGAELISLFHSRIGSPLSRTPKPRELAHAERLIADHGFEKARYIVSYALEAAPKTGFDMKNLGAVLTYEEDALEDFTRQAQAAIRAEHEKRKVERERLEQKYYRWRDQTLRETYDAMEGSRQVELRERVVKDLAQDGKTPGDIGYNLLVTGNLLEYVAAERGIPPFDEWYQNEYPALRNAGLA